MILPALIIPNKTHTLKTDTALAFPLNYQQAVDFNLNALKKQGSDLSRSSLEGTTPIIMNNPIGMGVDVLRQRTRRATSPLAASLVCQSDKWPDQVRVRPKPLTLNHKP